MSDLNLDDNLSICDLGFAGKLNNNFKTLNNISSRSVIDIINVLPTSPNEGDVYILVTHAPFLAFFDGSNWQLTAIERGIIYYVQDRDAFYYYNGTSMALIPFDADPGAFDIMNYPEASGIDIVDSLIINKSGDEKRITWQALVDYISNNVDFSAFGGVPVSTVLASASDVVPVGYKLCNGEELLRSEFPLLFAAIGTSHGEGNGSTTFRIPDYRGLFLRMVSGESTNDQDKNSRLAMNVGGAVGNETGSVQLDSTKIPNNGFGTNVTGDHVHSMSKPSFVTGPLASYTATNITYIFPPLESTSSAGNHSHTITGGDNQTAPRNAYVNYIIKV